MPEFAEHIRVVRHGNKFSMKINGQDFQWHITDDGVSTVIRNGIPYITVTIPAAHITIINGTE